MWDIKNSFINWMVCRSDEQIMEDAWDMMDEFDRLSNTGEIGEECEEMLKTVIELLTVLVVKRNMEHGYCETGVCDDHNYGEDYYVEETSHTYREVQAFPDGSNHCLQGVTTG